MPSFHDFSLLPATRAVLADMNITEPTPIQVEAIPLLLAGSDVVGQSATGSGKTLAYGLPLVERIAQKARAVQALVLVPTRELAVQVSAVLSELAGHRRISMALLVGGRPYSYQFSALRHGSQIVVGTPGRVKDHLDRGSLVLSQLRMCVLDEADQMLDSGFAPVIEEILASTPSTRQMALFSATIPGWVEELQQKFLSNPVRVAITSAMGEQSTIEHVAYQVPSNQKMAALCTLLQAAQGESSLIFGRTKFGVERLGQQLSELGFTVGTLHGNKSQRAREDVLTAFRRGHVQTLLATNVAARGLDIQGIYQVINYELPESNDLFTHRIGRTGRMGHQGKAITLLAPSDLAKWRRMARNVGQAVTVQRLAIDADAMIVAPAVAPTVAAKAESERPAERVRQPLPTKPESERPAVRVRQPLPPKPESERAAVRVRQPSSPYRGQGRPARPQYEHRRTFDVPKSYPEHMTREVSGWQPDEMRSPEHAYGRSVRKSQGREMGQRPGFARTGRKNKAHPFTATEAQPYPSKRKSGTISPMRPRRAKPVKSAKRAARS